MLSMFKGELTLTDILHTLPKKRLYELREVRKNILLEERKEFEKLQHDKERQNVREEILRR